MGSFSRPNGSRCRDSRSRLTRTGTARSRLRNWSVTLCDSRPGAGYDLSPRRSPSPRRSRSLCCSQGRLCRRALRGTRPHLLRGQATRTAGPRHRPPMCRPPRSWIPRRKRLPNRSVGGGTLSSLSPQHACRRDCPTGFTRKDQGRRRADHAGRVRAVGNCQLARRVRAIRSRPRRRNHRGRVRTASQGHRGGQDQTPRPASRPPRREASVPDRFAKRASPSAASGGQAAVSLPAVRCSFPSGPLRKRRARRDRSSLTFIASDANGCVCRFVRRSRVTWQASASPTPRSILFGPRVADAAHPACWSHALRIPAFSFPKSSFPEISRSRSHTAQSVPWHRSLPGPGKRKWWK